jgi:hypothetical protein
MQPQALVDFVERAGSLATTNGALENCGVSRIWRGTSDSGRPVDIGTNGSYYWVTTDLVPSFFPGNVAIVSAPRGTYAREKWLEASPLPLSGDDRFDSLFLALGDASHAVQWLTPARRDAFVEAADIHPSLQLFDPIALAPRVHLRCEPSVYRGGPGQWYELGSGPFTPENARDAAQRILTLAVRLETV